MHRAILGAVLAAAAASSTPLVVAPETFHLGRFGTVALYRPAEAVKGVVILMSGDQGWTPQAASLAHRLTSLGAAVAGVRTPAYLRAWGRSRNTCINPNVDMVALAQDVEHRLGLRSYVEPILVGEASGASLTYATVAQAPDGLYRGAVSLDFAPDLAGTKPWCRENGFAASPSAKGWIFAPVRHVGAPWFILQGSQTQRSSTPIQGFAAQVGGAQVISLHDGTRGEPQVEAAVRPLLEPPAAPRPASLVLPDNLPLTSVPSPPDRAGGLMAIFYSGDGGWAGLDRSVSGRLAAAGIPVVGLDSLKYFWTARSPAESARDLARIIDGYGAAWHRPRVLLVGYSFGAGALPATVAALPPAIRDRVAQISLMGLPERGELEFHLSDWLNIGDASAGATAPVVDRLGTILHIQCLRGAQEQDSGCPAVSNGRVQQIVLPGGHHFAGNDAAIAAAILRGLRLA